MPSASGTQQDPPPDPLLTSAPDSAHPGTAGPDPVLVREREYLSQSRRFLRLMREDVLSLRALGGDRVSEEYLKADLYRRAEALSDLPDTPLFFGRLDYGRPSQARRVRRRAVPHRPPPRARPGRPPGRDRLAGAGVPAVLPGQPGRPDGLALRRRFGFSGGELTAYEDEVFTERPAAPRPARAPVSRILDQGDRAAAVRPDARHRGHHPARPGRHRPRRRRPARVCVQGAPGTGKTAVGLHRVAYLLYAYRGADDPRRRAGGRAEPGLPAPTSATCCPPSARWT